MEFSLLYFSGDGSTNKSDKYKLLLETAKYADRHRFTAIWTPERHFHPFGGLYPNPAVIAAALATITEQIELRSGSVVLPLQHPVRVAEEWAVVDNISQGRIGISFASGWHADDFLLSPENYPQRREVMLENIEIFKKMWRGEQVNFNNGAGSSVAINTFPRPITREIPIWLTCGSNTTFREAGKIGANVLTSLLYETTENLAKQISLYRQSLVENGYAPTAGKVSLMLHTFIGDDEQLIREKVKTPFCNYISTHFNLVEKLAEKVNFEVNLKTFSEEDRQSLFNFAFERYLQGRVMIGTLDTCRQTITELEKIGVDEIACLIDFGLDFVDVMSSLSKLTELKTSYQTQQNKTKYSALSFFG